MELLARTLIFSFGSGVMFGPGRGTAGGCFVTPCQGVFLIRRVLWLGFCAWNSGIACQNLEFFIRFRSDVWPGQRDGRRLFRHAVPVCFPDSKGVLWLGFCAWNVELPARTLIWSFGSGVTFGRAVECLVAWFLCLEQWNCLPERHSVQE